MARLERFYRRRIPVERVITPELAKASTELSHEIRRQIGFLINRRGEIENIIVGTDRQLVLPLLARSRSGSRLLRGVRFVHTHLKDQPLTKDDLTDLALLRLDMMVAIGVGEQGEPGRIFVAHLLPTSAERKAYVELAPTAFHSFQMECQEFVQSLESEIGRETPALKTTNGRPGAILVSVYARSRAEQEERLAETKELIVSQGIEVLDVVEQRLVAMNPKYVMGSGKLTDVIIHALQSGAEMLIFDRDLTPTQIRSISEKTEMKVLDRTQLILDIFAKRAHSRSGKIQVELAQMKYVLPRLSQSSTALSRLGGGIGGRGPGETKLETDLRRVRDRITHLESDLESLTKHRIQQRAKRTRNQVPVVSIVGYTNAGKSTLLNALTDSHVPADNRPFETLDTVSRRLHLPTGQEVILTDTVGFIRDLPQGLLKAFRTTLEELHDADLLLHVIDASASDFDQQIQVVEHILLELELDKVPRIFVLNKCDRLQPELAEALCYRHHGVGVSALHKETLHPIYSGIVDRLRRIELESNLEMVSDKRENPLWDDPHVPIA
ncbi:GTPase HflX [Candidatus Nitronereus thalassa]|uniref:GTPase HflX n=1 Tax=Candidatus Nitronereus thalassa TaxID=3020898 RepID=A0ABU3K6Q0_9BACT|nr:GTPase HflX [Candidatus Nitronereus thalassa]MDT7042047.1 GTPase HflX [Candidatus Nitronereus thalassa]